MGPTSLSLFLFLSPSLSLAFLPIFSRRWIPRAMADTVEATRWRRGPSGGAADGVGEVGAVAQRTASALGGEARWTVSARSKGATDRVGGWEGRRGGRRRRGREGRRGGWRRRGRSGGAVERQWTAQSPCPRRRSSSPLLPTLIAMGWMSR
uniref:Uncharacterized protein n=1 Tax=Oryza barthii TaxID=65489 RepID=A0A0D3HAF3_9ORYZ